MSVSTAHHPEGVLIVPSNSEIWVIGEDDEVFEYRVASEADLDCPAGPSAAPTSAAPTNFPTPAPATLCDTSGMAATSFWGTSVSECPGSSASVCVAYEQRNYGGGFGATCDGFCAVYGLVCSAAHHDSNNDCAISSTLQCDDPGSVATSDHICTCKEASAVSLCDTSGMSAQSYWGSSVSECPGSTASVCVAYEQRNYDGGFGATCDGFCGGYGLVCTAAHHDTSNGCETDPVALACDSTGGVMGATSDHICTCEEASSGSHSKSPTKLPTQSPTPTISANTPTRFPTAAPVAPTPAPTIAACGCDQIVLLKIDGAGDPADTITLYNMGADACAPTDVFWIDDFGSAASGKTWSLTETLAPGPNTFDKGAANSFSFGISSTKDTVTMLTSCGSTSSLVIDDSLGTGSEVTSILNCGCDAVTLQSINGKNPDTITLFGSAIECRLDASNGWKIDDSGSAASGKTWSFAGVILRTGSNTFTKNAASSFTFGISSTSDTVTLTTPCGTTTSLSVTSGSGGMASASNAETLVFPGCKTDCVEDTSAQATTPSADTSDASKEKEVLVTLGIIGLAGVAILVVIIAIVVLVVTVVKVKMAKTAVIGSGSVVSGKKSGPPKPVKPSGVLPGIALTRLERRSEIV